MSKKPELDFHLHPPQYEALLTPATEVLYGGAAGGGKSFLMRSAAVFWCTQIPNLQCYLFRRLLPDLIKTHMEGPKGLRSMLHPWVERKMVKIVEDEVRFLFNGSRIYLSHCHEEADIYKYLSVEIHLLLMDEGTTFSEQMYRFLRTRVRLAGVEIPEEFKDMFPRILIGSNPGGIGHEWMKRTFVDTDPDRTKRIHQAPKREGGMLRQFLPAKLTDNPTLMDDDPDYMHRLEGIGSPALVKAYKDGDWGVVAGAFFPEFDENMHVLKPFDIPQHWTRYRAMDWGSYDPCCVLWGAVADGELYGIPKGALVVYREWYLATPERKGLRMYAEEVARGILMYETRQESDDIFESVTGKDTFDRRGAASVADRMASVGVFLRKIQQLRPGGWDKLRSLLIGQTRVPQGRPHLFIFNTCTHLIRTLPALQHHHNKPNDTAEGEDHPPDALRYLCSANLQVSDAPAKIKPLRGMDQMTFNELLREESRLENDELYF